MKRKLSQNEMKQIMLDILIDLQRVCDENKLNVFLAYGTLLGAIRHKGFIPWDDDIDVMMLRPDYEKLIKIYNEKRGKDYYLLCCLDNGKAHIPYAKIVDLRTASNCPLSYDSDISGLWIDIFPIDGCPSSLISKTYHSLKNRMLTSFIGIANHSWQGEIKGFDRINKLAALFYRKIGVDRIARLEINNAKKHKIEDYKTVCNISWASPIKQELEKTDFYRPIEIEFEGYRFYSIDNYQKCLIKVFGENYMELPPESERYNHKIEAWMI